MNALLVLIILAIACATICVRKSPQAMLSIAAWLLSTVDADEARTRVYAERLAAWKRQLGIEERA